MVVQYAQRNNTTAKKTRGAVLATREGGKKKQTRKKAKRFQTSLLRRASMSLRVRYTPAASRSPRCLPTSCTRFRLPNQSRSFHSLKISHRPSVFVASRCSILNRTLSRTPARSMDSLLSKNSLNINRNHCIVFPISSRGIIRHFSTDPIEVEPSNRKAAFVLNHSGLIFFLPLAVFAVICIIYVYESTIAEHPYIASVKATLVSGTRLPLSNDTTTETPLYSSEEISAYLPHITTLLRTNDSPSFHPSYWLLTAPNVELVRQLLRAALSKEEPGIVYFRATDATTIGQELCKLFSVNYSDSANGIHTTLRKIITGVGWVFFFFSSSKL